MIKLYIYHVQTWRGCSDVHVTKGESEHGATLKCLNPKQPINVKGKRKGRNQKAEALRHMHTA